MKKVSEKREELRNKTDAITRNSRKFRGWGLAFLLLGIGITLSGFSIGMFIYSFSFGLLLFFIISDLMAWRLNRRLMET
ncbi:MAG: hypothetical protein QF673_03945 [Candidatus Hydrothermarchaeota archaeon]|jgi:hypothetical protein|nr:hypothetical protein [Candidatus Hydrothermarchaeota archaeon]MDP6613151.1 hypothetical protein [Candidatus Hydrothermarchaeota archaeon]